MTFDHERWRRLEKALCRYRGCEPTETTKRRVLEFLVLYDAAMAPEPSRKAQEGPSPNFATAGASDAPAAPTSSREARKELEESARPAQRHT